MMERWLPIPGYEGIYEVSSEGRVRRCGADACLKPSSTRNKGKGYLSVGLSVRGKSKVFDVHRLVAIAFLRLPVGNEQVNHKNFDQGDNRLSNLEWVTPHENTAHSIRAGRYPGERNVVSPERVREVRRLHRDGLRGPTISRMLGMSKTHIYRILQGESHAHIS